MQMNSAGVYVQETDLSQIIVASASAIGAIVFNASRGRINERVFTGNTKAHKAEFGSANAKVSYAHYAAQAFLSKSNMLWNVRVTHGDHKYGGALLVTDSVSGDVVAHNIAVNNPSDREFDGFDDPTKNLLYIHQAGPGSDGENIFVAIRSTNVKPLDSTSFTHTVSQTGGTLPVAPSYAYDVTVLNEFGEYPYASKAVADVSTGSTNSVTLSWPAVRSAVVYNVYRNGKLIGSSTSNTFTDVGGLQEEKLVPVVTPVNNQFTLQVYDYRLSKTAAIETYNVSLTRGIDGFGKQTEIGEVVNNLSGEIRVENLAQDWSPVPVVYDLDPVALSGGTSGSAPTTGDYIKGWQLFSNPETSEVTILINGGYAQAPIQLAMDAVAHTRGDAVAVLDVPSFQQAATKAVEYRKNTLNLNSNRSALYTPDVKVYDEDNDIQLFVPPSGHVASVYAYNDFAAEAWFAPAGLNRGLLSILGLAYDYEQAERDLLAPNQVNYIRKFPGQGYAVWEQLTLQAKASSLSYVNVRRLLDVIEKAVSKALLYSVQEPSDDLLRTQIVSMIEQFLDNIQRRRGVTSFKVVCDTSNNSAQTRAEGKLNVDVYITPTLAAAKIKLNMVLMKEGMSFEEAIAAGGSN